MCHSDLVGSPPPQRLAVRSFLPSDRFERRRVKCKTFWFLLHSVAILRQRALHTSPQTRRAPAAHRAVEEAVEVLGQHPGKIAAAAVLVCEDN